MTSDSALERITAILALVAAGDDRAFHTLSEYFKSVPVGADLSGELQIFAEAWGAIDGLATMCLLDEINPSFVKWPVKAAALESWAARDPEAALAWARNATDTRENWYLGAAIRGLARSDLAAAASELSAMPESAARNKAAEAVLALAMRSDPEAAFSLALGFGDQALRASALAGVAENYARSDLPGAIAWIAELEAEGDQVIAVPPIASAWAAEAPRDAAAWALGLRDETARHAALAAVASGWTRSDSVAVSEWLGSNPRSAALDGAVEVFAKLISRQDPAASMLWADSITAEPLRSTTIRQIAATWISQSEQEAREFLMNHPRIDSASR